MLHLDHNWHFSSSVVGIARSPGQEDVHFVFNARLILSAPSRHPTQWQPGNDRLSPCRILSGVVHVNVSSTISVSDTVRSTSVGD